MLLHLFDCCNEEWVTQKHKRRVRFVIKTSFSMVKKWAAEFIHGRASILCEVRSGSILCEVRSRRWQPLRTTIKSYDSPMQHSHEYIVASTWVSFIKQNKFTRSYAKFWFFFFSGELVMIIVPGAATVAASYQLLSFRSGRLMLKPHQGHYSNYFQISCRLDQRIVHALFLCS